MADNDIDLIRELRDLERKLADRISEIENRFISYATDVFFDKRCCDVPRTELIMSVGTDHPYELDNLPAVYFEWVCGDEGSELACSDSGQGGLITVQELLDNTR